MFNDIEDEVLNQFEKMLEDCEVNKDANCPILKSRCDHKWKNHTLVFTVIQVCEICGEKGERL